MGKTAQTRQNERKTLTQAEITAHAAMASRGDILPACMRLVGARAASAWSDRTSMALVVGPACRRDVLDMACSLMPRAVEPRLLRAAAFMAAAQRSTSTMDRDQWLAAARRDLDEATRLDASDVSVCVLYAELARIAKQPRVA